MNVISYKNLPARLPIFATWTIALLLDRFNASEWIWGVASTFMFFVWVAAIQKMFKQKQTDLKELE